MSRYAGLGFDPAPGTVDSVRALAEGLANTGQATGDAAGRIADAVAVSHAWQGDVAEKFRRRTGAIPLRLHDQQETVTAAADVLFTWATTLADLQRQAEQHDRQARGLTDRIADAAQLVDEWVTAVSVASTHTRPQAEATLTGHRETLGRLRAELASVLDSARRLSDDHRQAADQAAARLREVVTLPPTSADTGLGTPRPALVTDIGILMTGLSTQVRQASAAAGLVPAGSPARPPGAVAIAVAAMAASGVGSTWTFGET